MIVALYVAAAVLPLLGFGRLLQRAQSSLKRANEAVRARGSRAAKFDDFNKAHSDITAMPREIRDGVFWDIVFVGLGLIAGAVASIWSLFI